MSEIELKPFDNSNDVGYLPECAFKFVYQKATDPDYAEQLVEDLK